MRADPVLLLALAALGGQAAAVAPLPALLALLAAAALLAVSGVTSWRLLVAAGLLCGLSAWRAHVALESFERERVRVRDALVMPARCAGAGKVIASPVRTGDALAFVAELGTLDCEGRRVAGPVLARLHGGPPELARGDRFEFVGQLAALQLFRNAPAHDPLPGAVRRGVTLSGAALSLDVVEHGDGVGALIDRLRAHARARIVKTFAPDAAGMARALVLGENDLDPEDDAAFRRSGLSHMLAVSGTHLVFAVLGVVGALGALLVRWEALAVSFEVRRLASAAGIPLALLYADFAGGSGSAWRAAWMLAFGFSARAANRGPDAVRSLAASLVIGALADGLVVFDVSFLLSAAATFGLIGVGPSLARPCRRLPVVARFVGQSMAATVAAMLPCLPLLALLAPELTVAGVLANVLAAPFGETIALPLCLGHVLLAPFPALERGVALVASGALLVVKRIAHESAAATFLAVRVPDPTPWHFALVVVLATALAVPVQRASDGKRLWRWLCVASCALGVALLEVTLRRVSAEPHVLRITALDVGQGDANLLELPDGTAWLFDAGGMVGNPIDTGAAVVVPVLRAKRRTRLDVVVLTHPHPDHFGGLLAVLRAVDVGELWDSGQGEREGAGPAYAELLRYARAKGIPVRRPAELCGHPRRRGGATLELLAPCPTYVPGRGANDNSLVVRVHFGRRSALLMGDAEALEEVDLVRRSGTGLVADYLKAGHHGSRTSTGEALLAAVQPSWVSLSSGVRNRFGHPHLPTLERLAGANVNVARLDRSGSFEWRTDGERVETRAALAPR